MHFSARGRFPCVSEIEQWYNNGDYFLIGSHHLVPIVPNILSFRTQTSNGRLGMLWQPGDASSLRKAIITVLNRRDRQQQIEFVSLYLKLHISFPAIGQHLAQIYRKIFQYDPSLEKVKLVTDSFPL